MARLKTLLLMLCLGTLAGLLAASLLTPSMISWYNIPGGGDAMCHCVDLVHATLASMLKFQAVGAATGGALGFIGGLLLPPPRKRPVARQDELVGPKAG